jgi:uncharacterized protein
MTLLCPTCKVDLVMSDRQGIEIDYCPKCRGVWLDRGELDKIIERSGSDGPEPYRGDRREAEGGLSVTSIARKILKDDDNDKYRDSYGHKGTPYGYKKKKSWLKEIFD